MNDFPRCPYCGDRMELQFITPELGKAPYTAWYQCVTCDSMSPHIELPASYTTNKIEEKAFAIATNRVKPTEAKRQETPWAGDSHE